MPEAGASEQSDDENSATNESSRCRPQLTAELRDSTTRDARE